VIGYPRNLNAHLWDFWFSLFELKHPKFLEILEEIIAVIAINDLRLLVLKLFFFGKLPG
jgi:hypothetical protein